MARHFFPGTLLLLSMLALGACNNANLGDIDESVDSREQMPGPGIFADEDGNSALSWSTESKQDDTQAAPQAGVDERTEFEQYKTWQALREQGSDSPEYREFQQWLEYQEFKSSQQ